MLSKCLQGGVPVGTDSPVGVELIVESSGVVAKTALGRPQEQQFRETLGEVRSVAHVNASGMKLDRTRVTRNAVAISSHCLATLANGDAVGRGPGFISISRAGRSSEDRLSCHEIKGYVRLFGALSVSDTVIIFLNRCLAGLFYRTSNQEYKNTVSSQGLIKVL